jgi:hypothetical protein
VGPHYYAPGAQTLRFTPAVTAGVGAPLGYATGSEGRDLGLLGYRNRHLFADIGRPEYAAYDRIDEAILPYGDATPNRQGFAAGLSAALGPRGWLKPRAYYTAAEEIKPNWVLVPQMPPTPDSLVAVDSTTNTATPRTFTGLDAALELDLAALWEKKTALGVGAEYKTQTSDLSYADLKTDTMVAYLDVMPPHPWFKWADLTLAYRQVKSRGNEYGLGGTTLAAYPFYGIPDDLGSYQFVAVDLTRTEIAFSLQYRLSKLAVLRGDWVGRTDKTVVPGNALLSIPDMTVKTRGQTWRMMYEASF